MITNLNVLVNLYFEMYFCTKWNVSYFLCHLFAFHESSSASIKSPPLFVLVFISEFYLFIYLFIYFDESTAFTLITTCTEHKLFFRITASFPRYLLQKVSIRVLWLLHFVIYFYSEVVLQDLSKNNPAEKQIHADI